jgi:predicted nucleic acid-binding protein
MALLQRRLGTETAMRFARDSQAFLVEWVDERLHGEAVRHLARAGKRQVSLVDQVSFLVMRRRQVKMALAFDEDFEVEGFTLFGSG